MQVGVQELGVELSGDTLTGNTVTGNTVTDDGVSLTIATREPALVLAGLADKNALGGLRVQGATLEDVFLDLTGREYRA